MCAHFFTAPLRSLLDVIIDTLGYFLGGLAEEVDEKVLHAAFIPFGELVDIQMPLDYETEKHRGFAFIEFEASEDAMAAIDNLVIFDYIILMLIKSLISFQNDSELFGRTIRVNFAKPQRIKEGSTRPVWSEDTWLQQHAGETLDKKDDKKDEEEPAETDEKVGGFLLSSLKLLLGYLDFNFN